MIETLECPNCGAPINPRKSLKCEYCNSIFKTDGPMYVQQTILYADNRIIASYDFEEIAPRMYKRY